MWYDNTDGDGDFSPQFPNTRIEPASSCLIIVYRLVFIEMLFEYLNKDSGWGLLGGELQI